MPVIINEIVFRGEVGGAARPEGAREALGSRPEPDARRIVEACVEEVLRILERKAER